MGTRWIAQWVMPAMAAALVACGGTTRDAKPRDDPGPSDDASSSNDAGPSSDARPPGDARSPHEASSPEGGVQLPDSAPSPDARPPRDGAPDVEEPPLEGTLVLARGLHSPTGIAVDATGVYFASRDDGTILKCPRIGCGANAPMVIASGQVKPGSVTVNATHLYWATDWRLGSLGTGPQAGVFRCALPACSAASTEPVDTDTFLPYEVRVVADRLYFAAWPAYGDCAGAGCASEPNYFGVGPAVSIDVNAGFVYVALYGWGDVVRCSPEACAPEDLVTDISPVSIAVDDGAFYVADYASHKVFEAPDAGGITGRILACPLEGCGPGGPTVLATDTSIVAVAQYGERVYYTNMRDGTVVSVPK